MSTLWITAEQCEAQGGHCFEDDGYGITQIKTSYPQTCKHCGATRWKTACHPWEYTEVRLREES